MGSWSAGAKLPQPMSGLKATNIKDRVLLFGNGNRDLKHNTADRTQGIIIAGGEYYIGGSTYYDNILEYDQEEDSLVTVGQMTQARAWHAITVVNTGDYDQWCT